MAELRSPSVSRTARTTTVDGQRIHRATMMATEAGMRLPQYLPKLQRHLAAAC